VAVVVTLPGLGGCVSPAHHDAYKLTTKDGPVLIELENGFTRSYPCSVLYKLAVRGISDAGIGVVQIVGAVDLPTAELKLNVTENQLRPAASEITASLYRYGVLQKTVSAAVPAPGAAPQAVFLDSVSSLARRLMSNETAVFPTV
jgi:hypothetical protein